jgi:hypothetical protein
VALRKDRRRKRTANRAHNGLPSCKLLRVAAAFREINVPKFEPSHMQYVQHKYFSICVTARSCPPQFCNAIVSGGRESMELYLYSPIRHPGVKYIKVQKHLYLLPFRRGDMSRWTAVRNLNFLSFHVFGLI